MITGAQVLEMLIPSGGWVITGDSFEGIEFLECDPITEQEFNDGYAKAEKYFADMAKTQAEAKAALLERLGITADEAVLLLG
jgi:hypothetical protein